MNNVARVARRVTPAATHNELLMEVTKASRARPAISAPFRPSSWLMPSAAPTLSVRAPPHPERWLRPAFLSRGTSRCWLPGRYARVACRLDTSTGWLSEQARDELFRSQAMLLTQAIGGPLPEPSDKAGAQT